MCLFIHTGIRGKYVSKEGAGDIALTDTDDANPKLNGK